MLINIAKGDATIRHYSLNIRHSLSVANGDGKPAADRQHHTKHPLSPAQRLADHQMRNKQRRKRGNQQNKRRYSRPNTFNRSIEQSMRKRNAKQAGKNNIDPGPQTDTKRLLRPAEQQGNHTKTGYRIDTYHRKPNPNIDILKAHLDRYRINCPNQRKCQN